MTPEPLLGKWFLILGEPMQVIDECLSARGHHYVWLRGPRHVYARQRDEIHEAKALETPATAEDVRRAAMRWAERLRQDLGSLNLWEQGVVA